MKKIYAFIVAFVMSLTLANAQYYYLPYPNAGTNPGGLNVETEYPVGTGLSSSWTVISGSSVAPKWSSIVTLPFTFQFNGVGYTQFKVSTSGVLTFSTGATAVPPATRVPLPNANIPDNSVCVLGIKGSGTNDSIVTQTFGVAGSQQTWVLFSSYTSVANASIWSYWSIVLEEGTNNIYIVDQRHAGAVAVSLGLQYNPTSALMVTGSPNLLSLAGTDPTPVDNMLSSTEHRLLIKLNCVRFLWILMY